MANQGFKVMDSDIDVMEPGDLWVKYIHPKYRDRAPRREQLPDGGGMVWRSEGKVLPAFSDHPKRRALNAARAQRSQQNFERYREAKDRQYDAVSQLQAMEVEGIDVAIGFRTLGSHVIAIDDMDPELAAAMCRAFNRWLADFCREDPHRLKGAGIVPLHDVKQAVQEARYAVEELGMVALVLPSNPVNKRNLYDPYFDRLWAEAQDLGVPVAFHGLHAAYQDHVANRYMDNLTLVHASSHPVELMLTLGAMLCGGVFHRFPDLRAAYLEGTCGWVPWWLWRLDEEWEKFGAGEGAITEHPSFYFKRQCFVSVEPSETLVKQVVEVMGDDQLVISTDWPHDDSAYPHAIESFLSIEGLNDDTRRKVLWDNCARLYGVA